MNSAEIKRFLAQHAHEMDAFRGERMADMGTDQPAKWKRLNKMRFRTFLEQFEEDGLDAYTEPGVRLGALTDECWVRGFCCPDATALACVVTDPTDQQIVYYGYTAD